MQSRAIWVVFLLAMPAFAGLAFGAGPGPLGAVLLVPGQEAGPSPVPRLVEGIPAASAVAGGYYHSLALTREGEVYSWGFTSPNPEGHSKTPKRIEGLPPVVGVAAGHSHDLAVTADGRVYAWGENVGGVLGRGFRSDPGEYFGPAEVPGLEDVVAVAAGKLDNLALKSDGSVWAWAGIFQPLRPTLVENLPPATGISVGAYPRAVSAAGDVYKIGETLVPGGFVPVGELVPMAARMIDLSAGTGFSVAVDDGGHLHAWDHNHNIFSGDPIRTAHRIPSDERFVGVAAGWFHALALTEDGEVFAWGHNELGELGDCSLETKWQLSKVYGLADVVDIGAGLTQSLAVRSDGSVWTWGVFMHEKTPDPPPTVPGCILDIGVVDDGIMGYTHGGGIYLWRDPEMRPSAVTPPAGRFHPAIVQMASNGHDAVFLDARGGLVLTTDDPQKLQYVENLPPLGVTTMALTSSRLEAMDGNGTHWGWPMDRPDAAPTLQASGNATLLAAGGDTSVSASDHGVVRIYKVGIENSSTSVPGRPVRIEVGPSFSAVLLENSEIIVLSNDNATHQTSIPGTFNRSSVRDLEFHGDRLYVMSDTAGTLAFDISQGRSGALAVEPAPVDIPGPLRALAVGDRVEAGVDMDGRLVAIPAAPELYEPGRLVAGAALLAGAAVGVIITRPRGGKAR